MTDDRRPTTDDRQPWENGLRPATAIQNPKSKIQNPVVVCLDRDWGEIEQRSVEDLVGAPAPADLAYLIYTSGTTGRPKAVLVEHRNLQNVLWASRQRFQFSDRDVLPWIAPAVFDIALFELFNPLLAGGTAIILAREQVLDLDMLLAALERCTVFHAVPSLMQQIVQAVTSTGRAPGTWDHIRAVFVGGDVVPPALLAGMRVAFRSAAISVLYGPTEGTIIGTCYQVPRDQPIERRLIGTPLPNVQVVLADPYGHPAPIGVPGELCLAGAGVARGYLNRPDLTAERFIPNPFAQMMGDGCWVMEDSTPNTQHPTPSTRLYRTGDLARYLPDGNLEFLGRMDEQIKLRGFRIEPREIEVVLGMHPGVRECIVVAREDAAGDMRLVAYAVMRTEGRGLSGADSSVLSPQSSVLAELRTFLQARLPDYMLPSAFVILDALPITTTGKVDRQALPAPDYAHLDGAATFVAPRTPGELQLARIWEEVLDVRPIGVADNFFRLGGHSLLAMRLTAQIARQFGQDLPLAALFQGPTVEQQAVLLQRPALARPASPLVAIQPHGTRRPFFCVHPGGGEVLCYYDLARQLGTEQPFYALRAVGLDGEAEPHAQVSAMADRYVAALRQVQPCGPYLLGGWSLGGVVAFEMARQLGTQDEAVALVALFDPSSPAAPAPSGEEELALLGDFAQQLGLITESFVPQLERIRQLDPDTRLRYLLEQAQQMRVLPPDVTPAELRQRLRVFTAHRRALRSYVPRHAPQHITLFLASEPLAQGLGDPVHVWSVLADGVESHRIPGDHYTILRPPHVQILAERLRACLDTLQEPPGCLDGASA